MQKKLRHFFLAVKSLKQIIYLDSRDNFGPVGKNPDLALFFLAEFGHRNLARVNITKKNFANGKIVG